MLCVIAEIVRRYLFSLVFTIDIPTIMHFVNGHHAMTKHQCEAIMSEGMTEYPYTLYGVTV